MNVSANLKAGACWVVSGSDRNLSGIGHSLSRKHVPVTVSGSGFASEIIESGPGPLASRGRSHIELET
jgi:hypothetical protein